MRLFKKKEENVCHRNTYAMTIIFGDETSSPYKFTNVKAATAEAAVDKMKNYVAENGYFGNMTKEAVIAQLSAIDVKET